MSLTPLVHVDTPLAGLAAGAVVDLGDGEAHHLHAVLRLRPGDEVEVADGRGGHAHAALDAEGRVVVARDATLRAPPRPRLEVVQALVKGRKMDQVVRITVELGVDRLVPVAAERSVARLTGERAEKALQRWRAIARSACEQSRRRHRPEVGAIMDSAALEPRGRWLVADPRASTGLPQALRDVPADAGPITIAVGPEGGWSPDEVDRLLAGGATGVRLGESVLRTEHAAAAALAVTAAFSGRWD